MQKPKKQSKPKNPTVKVLGAVPMAEGVKFEFDGEIQLSKTSVPSKEWFVSWEAICDALFDKARKG